MVNFLKFIEGKEVNRFVLLICVTALNSFFSVLSATEIQLEDYLSEVRAHHEGIKAAELNRDGLRQQAAEKWMLVLPSLTGQAKIVNDGKETGAPEFLGTKTESKFFSLGLAEQTPIGTRARLAYELSTTSIEGVSPALVPLSSYSEGRPVLEVTQPLWRNFFGIETRAQFTAIEAKALAASYQESFRAKQLIAEAEVAYWRAYLAQNIIQLRSETKKRAAQLRQWAERRASLQLADRSDLLQADAALKNRELELQKAEDDAKEAFRTFNSFRGQTADSIEESFPALSVDHLQNLTSQARTQTREDTKSYEQFSRLTRANAQLAHERGQPTLEATASVVLNGRDAKMSESMDRSFGTAHPTYIVNVSLNAPLNFWATHDLRAGAEKEQQAAELDFKRKVFEEEQEWAELQRKYAAAKSRLTLTHALEESQSRKVLHERDRLTKGRTTTFQVLLFEEDFNTAKLNRMLTENEILTLHARLKTFN
jgi:outer membrane protein TolC